eukprot:gnl/Dysnectes_brevis/1552_a1761_1502.p1 GENE.gnl/Dysnectes_brevis/1552_a1761_1502~~gnl/Dysnectes_brevis/1552_a1761_1502.p1  ORF type:complete len:686 (+),score=264.05 gnl/Dysnectes_brevis/1552_a1761_1502:40-2058(+)
MSYQDKDITESESTTPAPETTPAVFGTIPWPKAQKVTFQSFKTSEYVDSHSNVSFGNILYTIIVGAPCFVIYSVLSLPLFLFGCPTLARKALSIGRYILWPFSRFLQCTPDNPRSKDAIFLLPPESRQSLTSARPNLWQRWVWGLLVAPLISVLHAIYMVLSWLFVVSIPQYKMHALLLRHATTHPYRLDISRGMPHAGNDVLLLLGEAFNSNYLHHSFWGMSIVFVNMLSIVVLALSCAVMGEEWIQEKAVFVFITCLVAIIPLAYYIGEGIARLSSKSSYAVGAVLNATFGSIIELILYWSALRDGKNQVVRMGITGSLVGTMLLLPGASMVLGGLKVKEMKINKSVASVSTMQLVVTVVLLFTPTFYYYLFSTPAIDCYGCENGLLGRYSCDYCQENIWRNLYTDSAFINGGRILQYLCACLLLITYLIGLWFTFKSHAFYYREKVSLPSHTKRALRQEAARITRKAQVSPLSGTQEGDSVRVMPLDDAEDEEESDDAGHAITVEWSINRCLAVMIVSTIAISIISETLITSLDQAVVALGISDDFAGLFFLAVIPNAAEYLNACQFAMQNHLSLSTEIGRSAALQVAHIQVPVLMIYSLILNPEEPFTMIFNLLNFIAVFFAVIILIAQAESTSLNYFKGSALLMIYGAILLVFFFKPEEPTPLPIVL